ncbi:TipJ family phage tail tip protein [Acinetobacter baumannii]
MAIVKGAKKGKGEARKPVVAPDSAQSKTYIKILYGLGEGEIEGLANGNQSIFLEGTPLQDANGNLNYSNVKLDFRKGTNDQDYIEGFPSVESETAVDVELKSGAPWVRAFNNIDLDAVRIRLKWGPLRQQDSSTGDVSGITIEYAIDIQTDGGAWTEVLKTKISDKTSANYERAHRIDLPKADSGWLIRVRRITPNSTSEFVSDKMYVEAFTEVVDAKLRYPNTALLGLQYDAETFGNVAKLAVDLKGRLLLVPTNYNPQTRQYTGIWDGTFKRAYTNNPAWIYYDLCTNDRYGLGNRLTPFMIDKWSLYRLAQYCDQSVSDGLGGQEPRFTCNVYIQNAEDAFSILMKLAGVFRAIAFWDGTSIICDADIPQDTYFTYTRANVVGGVFEYSGTRARDRHNVVKVAWDNPANHYKTEYEFVRDENAIAESGQVRILELDAWGCTSRGQAQRAGHWALKSEQKETRTVSFKVGLDGHIPLPGRVIEIADELFAGRANGGRVSKISADLKSITIDRDDVIAKAGDRLVINGENGKAQTRIVQSISGRVITVTLPFDENSIAVQNVWVLDAQDLATMKFRVISISQEEKHQFSITALQYNPQKFDEIDNGAFFEDAPISIINPSIQEPVKDVLITTESRVDQGINITTMIVSWMQAKGAVKYLVEWRKDDGSWIRLPQTGNNSVEVPGVYSGQYQARVTAISAFEIASLPVTSSLTEITGKQGLPPKIAFIRATGILFGMKLDWGFPPTGAKDTAYTEIEVSPDGINNIAQLGLFAYPTTTTTIQGLQPNLRQFYRGRLIDRIGNVGPWSEWVNGTTTADPEAVLDLISGHINESDLAQELQGKIENSVDVSEAAQAAANNAQAVASSAQTAANNAQAVASEAKTAASSAQSAATTAQTQASSAQKIANDASVIATNAKNTADQAAEDASSAITAAAEAKTTATNANTTATNAQTTANNASSAASKVASDLTTSTNQLNKKIADETDARTAAISKLNDGLTTETSQRKSEDAALLNNIETYKSSTNGTLSSLQTQINTNATNTSANTSKISSLDSRLTTNEGKTADAINAAATAQQTANTAVTNAAAAASAVTSLKSELSTGKGINNIIAPFSDPQELSPYIIGASRTVALVKSPMRIKGNAYDVTFNAVAGSIYFGSSSLATVNTAAAGVVSGGKRYMLSAYLKNLDATKQADVYFTLHWFKRAANGTFTASQSVLLNQATNNTRVTPSNDGGTISCKAVAAPPDAVAFAVICSGNGVYNVAGSRILIDMLMLEEVVGVDVPASTWTAGPTDLSAIKSALDANASAISKIDTRVTNAEGTITSQGNSITQLNNSVTSINGELTKKADATALNALTNRVSTAEGTITSQGNSITSLRNDLNATNDKVSSKADSSALNSLDSKVTSIDGRVTSNTSAVTSLQGRVSTVEGGLSSKADASALNNYYTKTEADSATSGAIDKFNSQLTIGGVNVVANSEAPRTSTAATNKEYLLYERSAELKTFYDENLEKPITISFEMSVPVAGPVQVYSSNGSAHQFVTSVNAIIVNQFAKYSVTVSPKAHTASTTVSTIEFYGTYGTGRIPTIRKLQIEAGTKATAWSPSPRDTKAAIDANASAIQTTQTKVDNIDGRLTTATDSITSLNSRMSTAEGNINSTNTAVGGLSTRMATAEGKITNQSDSIASLQNSVTSINGTLANKADSSAVNNLTSRVETAEGKISSQSGQITSLSNSLDLTSSNLNDVNVLARLLSLGKPLRDDPTFKTTSAGGLSAYNFPAGTSWIKQAKSTDNPTGSTNEMLIKATQALGGGWYPTSPTLVLTANKTFLIKQIIKMPVGTKLQAIGNATGTGGYIRILGNDLGTGKFETYYSVVQGGADLSGSTIQGHFRVIAGTNPPVPTVDNPVFVILASYEVFDVTAVNDTIPKAYSDAIAANANAINTLSNTVTQQGNTIASHSNSITTLTNKITNNDLSNLVLNPDFVDPKSDWTSGVIVDATDAAPNPPSPKALRLNNRDSYYGPFVKCNVGDMFYVSAWFATPNTSATASAVLGFNTRNSAGTYTWYSVAIKSTDKNAWGMVEGYFTVPNGMVDIRPWLQVSIAASEAAGQQWHVTNIQVRNITGNKKLATDLQATSSALSTLDSKVTNIDGRVTSASNNIVSLNNSVTNINATLAQKADATALNSLSNRVTNAEGNITSQGNSITSLTNSLAVSGKGGTNLLIKSNVVGLYDGVSYPHHTYKLGEDWEIGAKYTLIWCAEHKRGTGDNNSYLAVYAGGGSQTLQSIVNTDGKVISKVTFVKNSAVAYGPIIHFYMINRPTADKGTIGTVYWAVLVKGDVLTTDAWIPSPYDYIPDSNANAAAITNLTNTVTQQGNTLTSHTNSITSLDNSITSINGILNTKANTSAVSDLDSRVTDAEGKITANTSSITSLTANLKSTSNGITMSASIDVDPDSEWIYWTKNGEVARADDTTALGGKVYRFGNNAGNDHVNARSKAKLPFDQNKTYRIRARYRRVSGTGTVYCAVFGIAKDGVSHVNSSNTVTTDAGSSNYFVTNQAPALNAWQEVTVYVKGRAAGAATGGWTLDNPRQLPNATAFISVQFLANYSSAAGEVDLDYLIIEDADAIAANDATAKALSSLDTRVTTAEGKITSQGNSITSLTNSLAVSGKGGTNLLIKSNVVGLYDGVSYPHHTYKLGEDWEIGAKYTLIWCAEHKRGTGDNNSYLAVYAGGGSQTLQSIVNTDGKVISKVTFVKNSAVAYGPIIHFYMINRPTADKGTIGTVYWAVLVKGDVLTTDAWIPSPYDYIPDSNANAAAITNLTNTVTQQGNTLTSHTNSITSLDNSITSINGILNTKANTSAVSDLDSRVTDAEGKITANTSSITSLTANLKSTSNGITMSASIDVDPDSEWIYWTKNGEVARADDTTALGGKVYRFGNNAGNDHVNARSKAKLPFDQNKTYRIRARYRRVSGTGTVYCAVFGIAKDGVSHVNSSNTVTTDAGSSNYFVTNQAPALNAWQEVTVYVKGRAAGAATGGWTLDNPRQLPNATAFISVQFLANYSSAAGEVDLDYLIIEDADAIAANDATAKALSSLDTRVTTAEGKITSQGNSITSLTNSLAVSGKGGTNLLIKSNVVGLYDGVSYPHHTYKLGEDWEIGAKYTLIWCAEHKRGTGDNNSYLAVYAGGGSQTLQSIVNTDGKVISKVTFVKNSAVAYGPIIHFYMINRPTADKGTIGTVYWAVLVKGDVLTTDAWIPSPYDYIPDSNANAAAITNLTNTVTQQGNTLTSHTNSITSLDNSITSINGILNTKANTSAVSDLDSRVTDAEGKITANTSSITSLTANLKSTSNGITMSASIDVDPDSEWIYWTKNGEVARADDTTALGGKVYRFGNNAGNDHVNARSKAKLPFDQNKTYRIRARYRRVSGTGTVYCAVFGIAKDGVSHVNSSNTVTTDAGSSNYFVTNQAPALNAWQEVTVYVKGRAAGAATGGWTLDNPRQLPNATAFISVQFLANYSSAAGEVDLDYLIIEDADAIAANDATAKALSSLDTRVTTAEGKITSQGNSITQLNNSITTINGTLSTKADSSALTNLANRVTTAENSITSQGSSITSLNSSVTGILKDIEVTDTRSTNQPPSWYWSNYPKRIVREFKQASTIGLSGMGTYVSLETYVYYSDATGGPIIQIARGTDSKLTAERRSTSTSTWGTWVQDIKAISDGLANKAEASALSSLDSKVSVIDGKVSTQASSITTLQTTVGGNTASIQSQQQSIDGLKARATLKLQSGNLVGGVGIENDSKTVDFIIQANKFAIGAPSTVSGSVTPKYAFVYQSTATTLPNGTVIPAGLYLDSASISYINANKIYADSLSAISANLGTFTSLADQSKPNGARTVISGERIEVYDENNVMRVRIGRW